MGVLELRSGTPFCRTTHIVKSKLPPTGSTVRHTIYQVVGSSFTNDFYNPSKSKVDKRIIAGTKDIHNAHQQKPKTGYIQQSISNRCIFGCKFFVPRQHT